MKKMKNREKTMSIVILVMVFLSFFALGWFGNEVYKNYNNKRTLDGIWLNNYNYSEVQNKIYSLDNSGEWVCVNIAGMSYERAIEVCNHEVGHEIFAEICEKNITKCLEIGK